MTVIIAQSDVIPWTQQNIDAVPDDTSCVYTLRSDTTIQSILYIGMAKKDQLKAKLTAHFNKKIIEEVKYFDWYQTKTDKDADTLRQAWILKFHPTYKA